MKTSTTKSYFDPVVHWVTIRVYQGLESTDIINFLSWTDMSYAVRTKWNWYFKYRAALEQVRNPRSTVIMAWGNKPAEGKSLLEIKTDLLRSRKGQITKISNAIRAYEEDMSMLLIWEKEKDEQYQKALAKLHRVEAEFQELTDDIEVLKASMKS